MAVMLLPDGAVGFDEALEFLRFGQGDEVAGDEELVIEASGGVFDFGLVLVGAKEQADGWLIAGLHQPVLPVVQVKIHLPGIAMLEGAGLQVDQQVAAQDAMVEDQVEVVMLVPDRDALLPRLEAEPRAQFEQEGLKVVEQRLFEVGFQIVGFFREAGEFEHIGVTDQIGDKLGNGDGLLAPGVDHGLFVGGKPGALVEQGADLALELALGPMVLEAFVFVEGALPRIVDGEEIHEVRPRELQEHLDRQPARAGFGLS